MKSLSDLIKNLGLKERELRELEKRKPAIAGEEAVIILQENFTKHHGFREVGGVSKWKERSKKTNEYYDKRIYGKESLKGSVYSSKNPLLLQSRTLYKSITYKVNGNKVTIGSNTNLAPYAESVNETRKIVGYNYYIRQRILRLFNKNTEKIMKDFKK